MTPRYPFMVASLVLLAMVAAVTAGEDLAATNRIAVASLNPIVSDLVRQVGGERIDLVEIMRPGQNPHSFSPSPADLRRMQTCALVLGSGMGLERYLADLRGGLGPNQRLVELGAQLPALILAPGGAHDDEDHDADANGADTLLAHPERDMSGPDPHWWQSIANVRRAAREVGAELAQADPPNAGFYRARQQAYGRRLDELEGWAREELAVIPQDARVLATSHAAFAYFCREFGFKGVPIQGLTAEQEPSPTYLRDVVDTIRREHVIAIFPEVGSNPKILANMVKETGTRVGRPLLAGSPTAEDPTYEAMIRYNVMAMVDALKPNE